jgi:hypothetical protein
VRRRSPHSPDTIARLHVALSNYWADPDRRVQHGALTKRRMARPGVSERISERTKAALADPEVNARRREAMASPVVRQRISERTREAMRDPAVRQRIRDGLERARRLAAELRSLRALWASLSDQAREVFRRELGGLDRS